MDKSSDNDVAKAIDAEIAAMREAVGVTSDTQLAEKIGISQASISQWRRRSSIPEKARQRVAAYLEGGNRLLKMRARRRYLGTHVLYEARCLALFLAPSLDATISRRFSIGNYMGSLRHYASMYEEIELACADLIHKHMTEQGGNGTDAFDFLAQQDPINTYKQVLDDAWAWRYGEVEISNEPIT